MDRASIIAVYGVRPWRRDRRQVVGFATVIEICSTPSQTARAISKRAPSTTRTSLRFRISHLQPRLKRTERELCKTAQRAPITYGHFQYSGRDADCGQTVSGFVG